MRNEHHSDGQPFDDPEGTGQALWRRARTDFAAEAAAPALDPLRLAAYLDGRLSTAESDELEALLAESDAALEQFLAADDALGATQAPSERLLARAAALVPGEAIGRARHQGLLLRLFGKPAGNGRFRLQPALLGLTLAALLALSVGGFELGRFGYAVAAEGQAPAATISTAMAELDGLGLSADSAY